MESKSRDVSIKADDEYFLFLDSVLRIRRNRSELDTSFANNINYKIPELLGYPKKHHYDRTNYEVHFSGNNSS